MALPQRTPSWYPEQSPPDDRLGSGEPLISVGYTELFGSDEAGDDEPWCVDRGDGMDVMSSGRVRAALAAGELSSATKVWRDGNGFWHEIGELPELVGDAAYERPHAEPSLEPRDSLAYEPVEQSTIRRVRRPSWEPLAAADGARPRAAAIASLPSLKVALVALALLLLPSAGYLAARVVGGDERERPPLRAKVADLGDRLVQHELTLRIQPFPRGSLGPRPTVTYVVPHPTRPGLLGMR